MLVNEHLHWRVILVSALSAFAAIGILSVFMQSISSSSTFSLLVLASMGATACLIFSAPHSPMAQPWPVFGGHLISAMIGVACAQFITNISIAAATTVALSIILMHLMRCLHPPSAATALIAVLGGEKIHALGWEFCYKVVLVNVCIILLSAFAISKLLANKRYPINHSHDLNQNPHPENKTFLTPHPPLSAHDFKWALEQMDGIIDVSEEDLIDLNILAVEHALSNQKQVLHGTRS
ncbi:MAG: HPP family protein [Methylotenera sp.]